MILLTFKKHQQVGQAGVPAFRHIRLGLVDRKGQNVLAGGPLPFSQENAKQ